jgi:hypothetical protein
MKQSDGSLTRRWIERPGELYFLLIIFVHAGVQTHRCRNNNDSHTQASYKLTVRHLWSRRAGENNAKIRLFQLSAVILHLWRLRRGRLGLLSTAHTYIHTWIHTHPHTYTSLSQVWTLTIWGPELCQVYEAPKIRNKKTYSDWTDDER